jgi:hypothetical protein
LEFCGVLGSVLIVHELGCHVFLAESGARQPIQLLGFGFGGLYTVIEEGLAGFIEAGSGCRLPSVMGPL